ncbi:MAG: hypothetical protein HQM14_07100 [SAR324 cluster bacterium]|nr:hypothetical protein [SAR324 cluster bacterium]
MKRNKRKSIFWNSALTVLILVLMVFIPACGGGGGGGSSSTETEESDSTGTGTGTATASDAADTSTTSNCVSPDFTSASETLGISASTIESSLGDPTQGPPDFAAAATTLGITETELRDALGAPEGTELCEPDSSSSTSSDSSSGTSSGSSTGITINGITFDIDHDVFTWSELPADVTYERQTVQSYTSSEGDTHYYEAVYVSSGNLNWYQAAYLAQDAGGYLASITSEGENTFVFNLVSDEKYFWSFPEEGDHYGISIGPFLGGYQPDGSVEPDGGWSWLSGESWSYTNWAVDLYCDSSQYGPDCNTTASEIDQDPRPNNQPNDSAGGQPVMGFGEMNVPVATWGDYLDTVGQYGLDTQSTGGSSYGFVIEYESNPN